MMKIESRSPFSKKAEKMVVGWQEWCQLPALGVRRIKVKIDTGAKTSALHAFNIKIKSHQGKKIVHFSVHPNQHEIHRAIQCQATLLDERYIMSSNGHRELRYVIQTQITLGNQTWPIELSLSHRDPLRFRMLLGREAMKHHLIVDPGRRLLQPLRKKKTINKTPK